MLVADAEYAVCVSLPRTHRVLGLDRFGRTHAGMVMIWIGYYKGISWAPETLSCIEWKVAQTRVGAALRWRRVGLRCDAASSRDTLHV